LGLIPCGLTGFAGILCGILAKSRIARSQGRLGGDRLATAGIVVSAVVGVLLVPVCAILAGMLLPALARAKSKANPQRMNCISHLKQLGLACRIYANDHDDKYPPDFTAFKAEIGNPGLLICPSDTQHPAVADWADFTSQNTSYPYFGAGLAESDSGAVVSYCTNHNRGTANVLFADGSVQQLGAGTFTIGPDGHMAVRKR